MATTVEKQKSRFKNGDQVVVKRGQGTVGKAIVEMIEPNPENYTVDPSQKDRAVMQVIFLTGERAYVFTDRADLIRSYKP